MRDLLEDDQQVDVDEEEINSLSSRQLKTNEWVPRIAGVISVISALCMLIMAWKRRDRLFHRLILGKLCTSSYMMLMWMWMLLLYDFDYYCCCASLYYSNNNNWYTTIFISFPGMSIHLLIQGGFLIYGTAAIPRSASDEAYGASGNIITCTIQGFFLYTCLTTSVFYYCSLSVYSYVNVMNNHDKTKYMWTIAWMYFSIHRYFVLSWLFITFT